MRSRRKALFFVILNVVVIAAYLFFNNPFNAENQMEEIKPPTLYELENFLITNNIDRVEIKEKSNIVDIYIIVSEEKNDITKVSVSYPDGYEEELTKQLLKIGSENEILIEVDIESSSLMSTLISFLPILIFVGFLIYLFNKMSPGGIAKKLGSGRAKEIDKKQINVTFDDVAGMDEVIEELEEIKDFLRNRKKFKKLGAKIPKGVLLFGPPGTGKTLVAKAVAGESNATFYSISGSDFVEMFVGVGAARVRDLFEQAKTNAPSIIFIDELDAIGRHRGTGIGGGNDEREQTLNQILVEMDGFDTKDNVIVIAATNRPDILDPALIRPGRFDRQVPVPPPEINGREAILRVHSKGKPLHKDVDFSVIARQTPGFTGADLANIINEAAILSVRNNLSEINMKMLEAAIERVMAGPERKGSVFTREEKELIANHETGHALVGYVLSGADSVHKISIMRRGKALGYTIALPDKDRVIIKKSELLDQIAMLLGGRAAEEFIYGEPTTGASNDIEEATKLALSMVTEYGMGSNALGHVKYGKPENEPFLGRDIAESNHNSEAVKALIDKEKKEIINNAYDEARKIISRFESVFKNMVEILLEKESVKTSEIEEIFGSKIKRSLARRKGSLELTFVDNS